MVYMISKWVLAMANYVARETITVTRTELFENEYLHPEKLRLSLSGKKYPLDLGHLAYLNYKFCTSSAGRNDMPYLVDEASLSKHRIDFLRNLIEYVNTRGARDSSIRTVIQKARAGFSVLDEYGYKESFLKDLESTKQAYNSISEKLNHKVRSVDIDFTPRDAELRQTELSFLIFIHYDKPIQSHIVNNAIKFSGEVSKTQPREIRDLRLAFDTYKAVALGLTEFLTNESAFPCSLEMPDYTTYLFPAANHRVTPYIHRPAKIYNYTEGRLSTLEEMYELPSPQKKSFIKQDHKAAVKNFNEANSDPKAKSRRALVCTAMQAYQVLFCMLTGAYIKEMAQVRFEGKIEVSKSVTNKSYRIIKFRAAGKVVQYEIASGAVAMFKRYLKLRKWVLNGKEVKTLFFGMKAKSWEPIAISESALRKFQREKMIGVFMPSYFNPITARQVRKSKSLFLHEHPDVEKDTVANVLGHSQATNEQTYMEVSPEKSRSELSSFWEAANEAARHVSTGSKTDKKTASGHCDDYLNPEPAIPDPPIEPNCRTQYGCLFCSHYICHADDKEDSHKLVSLQYIVDGVLRASLERRKAKELLEKLSARVRSVLHQISIKSKFGKTNVNQCIELVYQEGELTPYWENRLHRYEQLGLIFIDSADQVIE